MDSGTTTLLAEREDMPWRWRGLGNMLGDELKEERLEERAV